MNLLNYELAIKYFPQPFNFTFVELGVVYCEIPKGDIAFLQLKCKYTYRNSIWGIKFHSEKKNHCYLSDFI